MSKLRILLQYLRKEFVAREKTCFQNTSMMKTLQRRQTPMSPHIPENQFTALISTSNYCKDFNTQRNRPHSQADGTSRKLQSYDLAKQIKDLEVSESFQQTKH